MSDDLEPESEETEDQPQNARDDYDNTPGLNNSRLMLIEKSPLHFKLGLGDDSSSFRLGTAAHMATLEPEKFKTEYVVFPGRRQGNAWKDFEKENTRRGKSILNVKEHAAAVAIAESIRKHERANELLSGGQAEVGLTWTHEVGDRKIPCKGRADYIGPLGLIDVKTSECVAPDEFMWSALRYGYDSQLAWYHDGILLSTGRDVPVFVVAVEKKAPFMVQVFRVPTETLERGRERYIRNLLKMIECERTGNWHGYTAAPETELILPTRQSA